MARDVDPAGGDPVEHGVEAVHVGNDPCTARGPVVYDESEEAGELGELPWLAIANGGDHPIPRYGTLGHDIATEHGSESAVVV